MANTILTRNGKNNLLYRGYTANGDLSATEYLVPSTFRIGINNKAPNFDDTEMTYDIPIADGTVLDNGSTNMTGDAGGENSTDNTTTYKEGAGETDATSQNLITNDTSIYKIWYVNTGSDFTLTQPYGLWLYIKDATTLAYISAITIQFQSTLGTIRYYHDIDMSTITIGWNWITSNKKVISDLSFSASGTAGRLAIQIITFNATDSWSEGDVIYDLCRQWDPDTDLVSDIDTGFPSIDYNNSEVTIQSTLATNEANGFLIDSIGIFNEEDTPKLLSLGQTSGESKSSTDEFIYIIKERIL